MGFRSDEDLRLLRFAAKESQGNLPRRTIADVLYNLCLDLGWSGRFDEAEPIFKQALQIYLQDPLALCDQSAVYAQLATIKDERAFRRLAARQASPGEYVAGSQEGRDDLLRIDRYWLGAPIHAPESCRMRPTFWRLAC